MKGNDLMKAMNGINDEYLTESEMTVKQSGKHAKRLFKIGVGIAAAAVFAIPVGAYAYNALTHKDKVSIYYTDKGAQKLEENGLADGFVAENGQIRLTIDTSLYDGNFASGVITLTALTDEAKTHLETAMSRLVYADTGEEISPVGGGFECWSGEAHDEYELTRTFSYPLKNAYIDSSRPMRLEYYEFEETGEKDDFGGNIVVESNDFYDRIYFDLPKEPNVPTAAMRSADGYELTLSPYGVSHLDDNWKYPKGGGFTDENIRSFFVIAKDGSRKDINDLSDMREFSGNLSDGSFSFRFGVVLDIDNISGVEINGVEYLK